MKSKLSHVFAITLFISNLSYSSSQNIKARQPTDQMHFKISQEKIIEDKVRKCCSFGDNFWLQATGLSRITSVQDLGNHSFIYGEDHKWKKEKNGLIFTCKAGFIDITHTRDHADITLHIYNQLLSHPKIVAVEKSPTKRQFVMKEDYAKLNRKDLIQIAASMAYDISVWHELETLPKFTTMNFESNSAFSVEDNISNFIGTEVAVQAILNNEDFNQDVTFYLNEFLENSKPAQSKRETKDIINQLKKKWWKSGFGFKSVLKRHITPYGELVPLVPAHTGSLNCGEEDKEDKYALGLNTVRILSNGTKATDYYDFEIFLNKHMKKFLRKHKISFGNNRITTEQFQAIISSSVANYKKKLGNKFSQE